MKILFGVVLFVSGGLMVSAHAAESCILAQQVMPDMTASTKDATIKCVYSCPPHDAKVTQTIKLQQRTCAATMPAPK
jgi:hypothetical protein